LVENFGARRIWEKKTDAGREMFIHETGSTGSSSTGALVAAGSLQAWNGCLHHCWACCILGWNRFRVHSSSKAWYFSLNNAI